VVVIVAGMMPARLAGEVGHGICVIFMHAAMLTGWMQSVIRWHGTLARECETLV
jgi:hypothetical protein